MLCILTNVLNKNVTTNYVRNCNKWFVIHHPDKKYAEWKKKYLVDKKIMSPQYQFSLCWWYPIWFWYSSLVMLNIFKENLKIYLHFIYHQISNYMMCQIPKLKCFSSPLVVVFAQSAEARCKVENEEVVGAAPTGDAPTTSGWSTILFTIKVQLILEIGQYVLNTEMSQIVVVLANESQFILQGQYHGDLVTQGARASATMALARSFRLFLFHHPKCWHIFIRTGTHFDYDLITYNLHLYMSWFVKGSKTFLVL